MSSQSPKQASALDPQLVVYKAFWKAVDLLAVPQALIPVITGVSQPTLSRLKKHTREGVLREIHPKSYESILLVLRLFRSLDALWGGNTAHCREWLHTYNDYFLAVPLERIQTLEGLVSVVSY